MFSCVVFFFSKQKTAYEMRISDWSSDVCSSDLARDRAHGGRGRRGDDGVHRARRGVRGRTVSRHARSSRRGRMKLDLVGTLRSAWARLRADHAMLLPVAGLTLFLPQLALLLLLDAPVLETGAAIGRASWWERLCQNV